MGKSDSMVIEGRVYEVLDYLREMIADMSTHLVGQEDAECILRHQDQIPANLQGEKATFLFLGWHHPDKQNIVEKNTVYGACWDGDDGRWVGLWIWLGNVSNGDCRVLRRK